MRVEAGAQRELKGLAGDGPRRALHVEVAAGETLVEVALLQVQTDGGTRTNGAFSCDTLGPRKPKTTKEAVLAVTVAKSLLTGQS